MITRGQKVGFAGSTVIVTVGLHVGLTAYGHRTPCGRTQPDSFVGHSLGHGKKIFGQVGGQEGLFVLGQNPFFDRIHVLRHSLGLQLILKTVLSGDVIREKNWAQNRLPWQLIIRTIYLCLVLPLFPTIASFLLTSFCSR
jgi:hypothetical protein